MATGSELSQLTQGLQPVANNLTVDAAVQQFCPYWLIAKGVFETVKTLTPESVDKAIDEFITIADRICGNVSASSEYVGNFAKVWPTIRPVLETAKLITPNEVDKAIDEFVKLVNLITRA